MGKSTAIQVNDNADGGTVMDAKVVVVRDSQDKIIQGFVIGDTLRQNQAFILMAQQGEIKFRPDMGVGISNLLLGEDYLEYRHRIREHFEKDGLTVSNLQLYKDKPIIIAADYE